MSNPPDTRRRSRRTKTLDLVPEDDGSFSFTASLVDESFAGNYETSAGSTTIHHFVLEGRVVDDALRLVELVARAKEHPFPECPFMAPAIEELLGLSLVSNWRRQVLDRFGGAAGCTHLTTLLLGLSEVTTLIFFQRMNRNSAYGPDARASGEWIGGSLDFAPALADACHVLRREGSVIRQAELFRRNRDREA
ncbi:DUF2889 domain-containing protein [Rhodococcus sp. WS4]|nr:DUF2889 domain-containing protein [Rhodococcus sp. WS4]